MYDVPTKPVHHTKKSNVAPTTLPSGGLAPITLPIQLPQTDQSKSSIDQEALPQSQPVQTSGQQLIPEETIPEDLFPDNQPLRKSLRIKLTLFSILSPISAALIGYILIMYPQIPLNMQILSLMLIGLIPAVLGTLFVWQKLNPLERIYSSIIKLSSGELTQIIPTQTDNELSDILNHLNITASKLSSDFKRLSQSKDLNTSEKNKLIDVLSGLNEGLIVIDTKKQVLLMNTTAEKLTATTFADAKNKPIDDILNLSNSTGQTIPANSYCLETLNKKADTQDFGQMLKLINKSGMEITVNMLSSQIKSTTNPDLGWVISIKDVSQKRGLESMQLDFVSMASHELRTPLTSIKGYLSVFLDENKDKLSKNQRDFLDRIMVSAQQLASLVDNLLSVSKIERGAISVNAQSLDWKSVLKQALSDGQLQASEKNITLTLESLPVNLPQVHADPVRINEVINNLINNSINYTQEGGKITISCKLEGDQVITSVTDNGIGLTKDSIAHLFNKFYRIQGALDQASNSKGTGLGLYLSKSIIELHKGKIWADSPGLGKGATFSFSLPIAPKVSLRDTLTPLDVPKLSL